MSITLSIIDGTFGCPAEGIAASVAHRLEDGAWRDSALCTTDENGQIRWDLEYVSHRGVYRIEVATDGYFAALGMVPVQPVITLTARIEDPASGHHISMLITPYANVTYHVCNTPDS